MSTLEASDVLSKQAVADLRRLLDIQAIQDVMLRYVRCADRSDPEMMETIFWPEGTDDHGMFSGSGAEFMQTVMKNAGDRRAKFHLLSPVQVEFVDGDQAKVETYFYYVGTAGNVDETETLVALTGRYRDLFEMRDGNWRVLSRTVIYDTAQATPHDAGWEFFRIPEGINRGGLHPSDGIFAPTWGPDAHTHEDERTLMVDPNLSSGEIRRVREMLDTHAIQDVMLRYVRCADRNDPSLMATIFWDGATDNHGNYNGSAEGFFANALKNVSRSITRFHILGPVNAEFIDERRAKAESYFFYVGTYETDDGVAFGALTGRYRDLFEKRGEEWRVLSRTVLYDTARALPYEPGWDFFRIPEGPNRAEFAPHDAIYAEQW